MNASYASVQQIKRQQKKEILLLLFSKLRVNLYLNHCFSCAFVIFSLSAFFIFPKHSKTRLSNFHDCVVPCKVFDFMVKTKAERNYSPNVGPGRQSYAGYGMICAWKISGA